MVEYNNNMFYVIGTPIGNLSDLSKRAIDTLSQVDIIFAEDTRTALALLNSLGIKKTCKSYYKDNEKTATQNIMKHILNGDNVALVSEAGMPCISDPGVIIVRELINNNIPFEIIQGPTALIHGLIASGLSGSSFYFYGFLPHKEKDKIKAINDVLHINSPIIFYESPYRIKETLNVLLDYFKTLISVTREATKKYEETIFIHNKDDIEKVTIKGEFVIVVDNSSEKKQENNIINYENVIKELLNENISSKDILIMMKALGLKRNEAYKLINKLQS